MTDLAVWLAETTVVMSLLVGVILLVRQPLTKLANVRWVYLIWGVPAARLAVSLLPEPMRVIPAAFAGNMGVPTGAGLDLSWAATILPPGVIALLLAVWVAGIAATSYRLWSDQTLCYRRLVENSEALTPDLQRKLDNYCNRMQVFPIIDCRITSAVTGPVLLGVLRPLLLLPKQFFTSTSEPELVIRHELVHYKRRDLWCNLLVAVVRCVFWFNPFFRWAEQRFRDDQEIACDRAVLVQEKNPQRRGYVNAMIQATGPRYDAAVGFVGPEPAIKRRARAVVQHRSSIVRDLAGAMVVALLAIGGITFGIDAPATALEWIPALSFPSPLPGPCS